jgi:hypothetical protein
LLSSRSYTLTRGLKKVFVYRTLLFLWQASGVFGKPEILCVWVMSRLAFNNYDIMLGAILVLSRRLWVAVFFLTHDNVGPHGTLPVWKLRFSMLMGAILVVLVAQALEVFSVNRTVHDFVDSQDLLVFRTTCMRNFLRSCMV